MAEKGTIIDFRKLKCSIIREGLTEAGFDVKTESPDAQIVWWDGYIAPEEYAQFKQNQRINRIPQMDVLCYKSTIFSALNQIQTLFPQYYTFFPETFMLPHQLFELQKEHVKLSGKIGTSQTWIFKPKSGCCGCGIKLIQNPYLLNVSTTPGIIQRYVNPFLVDGYKFDFRVYALISTISPLNIFVYHEGLARFCTKKYVHPTKSNLDDKFCHITNTAINVENTQAKNEFTKLMTDVLNIISEQDPRGTKLWEKIKNSVVLTILAIYPQIIQSISNDKIIETKQINRYFHIIGIDILVDENVNPILLEINDRPSMKVTFPCEENLKKSLVMDTMKLITVDGQPVDPVPETGWERHFPAPEGSPMVTPFRSIMQRSLNVFGPRNTLLRHPSKQIIYPKPVQDKHRMLLRPYRPSHQ